jgi:hypothetical protein
MRGVWNEACGIRGVECEAYGMEYGLALDAGTAFTEAQKNIVENVPNLLASRICAFTQTGLPKHLIQRTAVHLPLILLPQRV